MNINYQGNGGGVPRKVAKIFAQNAVNNDVTVFGSTLAGSTQYTTDLNDIQNSHYLTGWRGAVISNKNYPLLSDMNAIQRTFSQQIAYLLQHGIPEWNNQTTYYAYDLCTLNGNIYTSITDSNTNNNPSNDRTNWAIYFAPSLLTVTGTVIWYTKSTAPTGYLVCDGSAVSRTDYADLFAIIGTTFGAGDSTTTFNLPDLIDQFIQGSTTVGTVKAAGLPNITGYTGCYQADYWRRSGSEASGAFRSSLRAGGTDGYDDSDTCGQDSFDASRVNAIYGNSTTVQPPSLTLLPCIKY